MVERTDSPNESMNGTELSGILEKDDSSWLSSMLPTQRTFFTRLLGTCCSIDNEPWTRASIGEDRSHGRPLRDLPSSQAPSLPEAMTKSVPGARSWSSLATVYLKYSYTRKLIRLSPRTSGSFWAGLR